MKLAVESIPLEVGGVKVEGEFSIKNSSKAFAILSSGLYSNKPQAILRELGANAYDSHVEAGKREVPFTVHLPTRLNPTLSIRDYGIGLDHAGVTKLYTTYFESTKTNSNDMIGCLGLGSKTPFSYTRSFTVVAIKDGTKRTYAAYINDAGIPAIALMGEVATDECNGLEVSFAVNKDDIRLFAEEAQRVYRWFKTKPEITGNAVTIPEVTYEERDIAPRSHLLKTDGCHRGSRAIMGNISYPISLPSSMNPEDMPENIRSLFNENPFVLEFDIGELDIAASREELSYIKLTIDSLRKRGEEIVASLSKYVDDKVAPKPTKWERTEELSRLVRSNYRLFSPAIETYVKNNPDKILEGFNCSYYGASVRIRLDEIAKICPGLKITLNEVSKSWRTDRYKMTNDRQEYHQIKLPDGTNYAYTAYSLAIDNHVIALHDGKGSAYQRIKAECEKPGTTMPRAMLTVQPINRHVNRDVEFRRLLDYLGNPPASKLFYTSNMPKVGAAKTADLKTLGVFQIESRNNRRRYSYDKEWMFSRCEAQDEGELETVTDIHGNEVILYVPVHQKTIVRDDGGIDANTFVRRMENGNFAKILGFAPQNNVYGVKKTSMSLVKDNENWKNFWDFLEEQFDAVDWNTARDKATAAIRKQVLDGSFVMAKANNAKLAEYAKRDTPFGRLAALQQELKAVQKAEDNAFYEGLVSSMHNLYPKKDFRKTGVKVDLEKTRRETQKIVDDVKKAYPLLQYLSLDNDWQADGSRWNHAITYMEQVDKANA